MGGEAMAAGKKYLDGFVDDVAEVEIRVSVFAAQESGVDAAL